MHYLARILRPIPCQIKSGFADHLFVAEQLVVEFENAHRRAPCYCVIETQLYYGRVLNVSLTLSWMDNLSTCSWLSKSFYAKYRSPPPIPNSFLSAVRDAISEEIVSTAPKLLTKPL